MLDLENTESARPYATRADTVERDSVMDLRKLTDQVRKLHALLGEQSQRISDVELRLREHEEVLGKIGAYEAIERE